MIVGDILYFPGIQYTTDEYGKEMGPFFEITQFQFSQETHEDQKIRSPEDIVIFMKILDPIQASHTFHFPETTVNDFIDNNPYMFEPTNDYYIGRLFYPGRIHAD